MILDFKKDTATVGGSKKDIDLRATILGHYALPIGL